MSELQATPTQGSRRRRLAIIAVAVLVVVLGVLAVVVPLMVTSTPEFFSRYHLLERRYVNLGESAHEGIGCRSCHETAPIANGTALIREFYWSYTHPRAKVPKYFVFRPPVRRACLKCHKDDWSDDASRTDRIPHPAHTRVSAEKRDCAKCHKWTAHFERYIDKHKTMPFSGVCVAYGCHVGTKETKQCYNCHHVLHEKGAAWRTEHPQVARAYGQTACMEKCHTSSQCQQCHTTGVRPAFNGLPIETSMKSIEKLHIKPEWTTKYHGEEALKGRDRCLKCHQSEGECGECHLNRPAFHGSVTAWIGRHKKVAKTVDAPRCLECHKATWCKKCHKQFEEME